MKLVDFIEQSSDEIVAASVKFARSMPNLAEMHLDLAVLSDHLPMVLEVIVADLRAPQSSAQAVAKSEGRAPENAEQAGHETPAQLHGRLRADLGLSIEQIVAEYRVLRATVTRLWGNDAGLDKLDGMADMIRFNEAIDQAVAESVAFYAVETQRWRDTLLATIAHDLRNPMNALMMSIRGLSAIGLTGRSERFLGMLQRSSARMTDLLESLLDFNRVQVGGGLQLHCNHIDLAGPIKDEVELLQTALPNCEIDFRSEGDTTGRFDAGRLCEALGNLVSNAEQHGRAGKPVVVRVNGMVDRVVLTVANEGDEIPPEVLARLYEPHADRSRRPLGVLRRNLGIGLFMVREIARAHRGKVTATWEGGLVTFRIEVPKAPATV